VTLVRRVLVVFILLLAGCTAENDGPAASNAPTTFAEEGPFAISSSAFPHMGDIPRKHTCDDSANNVSPPLTFSGVPQNASTLALIMEDPDAPSGTINHWTFWNLPRTKTELRERVDIVKEGGVVGNDYGGPCPPDGEHRYFFYAYAVDGNLTLASGAPVNEMRQALKGHVVAEAEMYGLYCRPNQPPVPCLDPI
jgi:Raf kinase inhibitor-like YbhB/YbcL family protein